MTPHSSTVAWKIPWTEEPGRLQSMGSLRVGHDWATSLSLSCIGEGNGNPLQCSCLENPRDGGAWWAAIYGVAQSRTWLKWLSSNKDWEKETTNLNFLTFLRLTPWSHLNSNIKQKAVKLIKELEKDTRQFCCFPIEKWFSNENLFYSSGNPTQCFVVTQMGRKSTKEGIYVYV